MTAMRFDPKLYSDSHVDWRVSLELIDYLTAVTFMEERAAEIAAGNAREMVWLLEHPPLYTAGTSADAADLVEPDKFDVFQSGRGGQYTYHEPGQRVGYVMLDLRTRGRDVSAFVRALEQWIIDTLAEFDITAERRCGRVGVWVTRQGASGAVVEEKIAAIGVRLRKWVSFHGISINLNPDLTHFGGIVPCGISEHGVASFESLGSKVTMGELDAALTRNFARIFGPVSEV
ncbi:lipoyl(octanoyl) transferase LipB [Litorimonas sp. RW-G-Af-16]|uniref:lipoyl(octanoyl) transferase LipB n=1 Tax=Litorimonas sp. RW-G-Af-16 TaxID=3241168 RepID=UPI003AADCE75